jgi:ubiquinone/menaquinone biosynthesis C-methylase UbiE
VNRLHRIRYLSQHLALALAFKPGQDLFYALAPRRRRRRRPTAREEAFLRNGFRELLEEDLANVENGFYGRELFQIPWARYLCVAPRLLGDLPRVFRRRRRGDSRDLPATEDLSQYPRYFRRTFHWQTDGYLSDRSARLYDLGVEVAFGFTGDVLRRIAIPPLVAELRTSPAPVVLDVGSGTGRFLEQLHQALPQARLRGLELSPFYAARARRLLARVPETEISTGNAESMPFADASFDAASAIFLFHELPRAARRRVAREVFRVLRPGAPWVVCDSAQADCADLRVYLESFPVHYHEPYYAGYVRDDLGAMLAECGFLVESERTRFVAKLVVARKPEREIR